MPRISCGNDATIILQVVQTLCVSKLDYVPVQNILALRTGVKGLCFEVI